LSFIIVHLVTAVICEMFIFMTY